MFDKETLDAMEWDAVKELATENGVHFASSIARGELQRRILAAPTPENLSLDREGEPAATAVTSPPTGPIDSIGIGDTVRIDPELDTDVVPDVTYSFLVGVTDDCPFQNVTCGITFPKFLGAYTGLNDKKEPLLPDTRGAIVHLTDEEFEMVKRKVSNTVVRSAGKIAILKVKSSKRYRPMPGDLPVGQYLYMRRIGEGMRYDFNGEQPEPMVV